MTLRLSTNASMRKWRRYFPLLSLESVVALFKEMLQMSQFSGGMSTLHCASSFPEPNLAFVSIILGYIETNLTLGSTSEMTLTSTSPKRPMPSHRSGGKTNRKRTAPPEQLPYLKRPSLRSSPSIETADSISLPPSVESLSFNSESFATTSLSTINQVPCNTQHMDMSTSLRLSRKSAEQHIQQPSDVESIQGIPVSEGSNFPILRFEEAESLYQQFHSMIVYDPRLTKFTKPQTELPEKGSEHHHHHHQKVSHALPEPHPPASRDLIRAVCDVLCTHIISARQREHMAHAQSVYSFLKTGHLDSFGLAFSTVAACQLLGYSDVYLALSEDHAWVEFGPSRETADVMPTVESSASPALFPYPNCASLPVQITYPPPVRLGHLQHSWLYLNGFPVVCSSAILSVAAAITAIQPCGLSKSVQHKQQSVSSTGTLAADDSHATSLHFHTPPISSGKKGRNRPISGSMASGSGATETTSLQLVMLKQSLLWVAFKTGLLSRYPLGLTNLADIEEGYPSSQYTLSDLEFTALPPFPSSLEMLPLRELVEHGSEGVAEKKEQRSVPYELLHRAAEINRVYFQNQHVYPYIYLANYLHRHNDFEKALKYWAEAARVIGQYNHSTEDAEIYREFLTIATQIMPEMLKSIVHENRNNCEGTNVSDPNGGIYQPGSSLLDSPFCLAYLLAFFDHLCLWEEGSLVPVLHVGWVDELMRCLTRFSPIARELLHLEPTRLLDDTDHQLHQPQLRKPKNFNSPLPTTTQTDSGISSPVTRNLRQQQLKSVSASSDINATVTVSSARSATRMKRDAPSPLRLFPSEEDNGGYSAGGKLMLTVLLPPSASASPNQLTSANYRGVETAAGRREEVCLPSDSTSSSVPSMTTGPPTGPQFLADELSVKQQLPHVEMKMSSTLPQEKSEVRDFKNAALPADVMKTLLDCVEETFPVMSLPQKLDPEEGEYQLPKENLISYLAHASKYRLLNPAFLLGTDLATPFLSAVQFNQLSLGTAMEEPSEKDADADDKDHGTKGIESDYSSGPRRSFSSSTSSSPPHDEEDRLEDIQLMNFSETSASDPILDSCDGALMPSFSVVKPDQPEASEMLKNTCDEITNILEANSMADESREIMDDEDEIDLATLVEKLGGIKTKKSPPQVEKEDEETKQTVAPVVNPASVHLYLFSVKMSSISHLLNAPKRLNSSAIKLCLTAQSQVIMRRRPDPHLISVVASSSLRSVHS